MRTSSWVIAGLLAVGCTTQRGTAAYEVMDTDCNELAGVSIADDPRVLQLLARFEGAEGASSWRVVSLKHWHNMDATNGDDRIFDEDCEEGQVGWRIVYVH